MELNGFSIFTVADAGLMRIYSLKTIVDHYYVFEKGLDRSAEPVV